MKRLPVLIGPTLQALYDSEIHFSIQARWDKGFEWELGIPSVPAHYATGWARSLAEAVLEMGETAIRLYPSSEFAIAQGGGQVQ
jgi:hypothetical protein